MITQQKQAGFTLFEICIALMMIAVGFLGVLATISSGIRTAQLSKAKVTGPIAARSAAVYCMVNKVTGTEKLGGTPIPSADITKGNGGAYHPGEPVPAPVTGNADTAMPFNGYALKVNATADGGIPNLYKVEVEVYGNVMDRDATPSRKRLDIYTFKVMYR